MDELDFYKSRYNQILEENRQLQINVLEENEANIQRAIEAMRDDMKKRLIQDIYLEFNDKLAEWEREFNRVSNERQELEDTLNNVRTAITEFLDQFDWGDHKMRGYVITARNPDLIPHMKQKLSRLREERWAKESNFVVDIPGFERDVR